MLTEGSQLQLNNNDPISRQETLNYVLERLRDGGLGGTYAEKIVFQAIQEMPPAKESVKWNSVSEKLPTNVHEKVWVAYYLNYDDKKKIHTGAAHCFVTDYGKCIWNVENQDLYSCTVLEWAPLPESRYETAYEQQIEEEERELFGKA